ncbi:MAG: hypothetical protein DRN68_04365 [Thaumarchaeota archaeon]|nr:MAG: hypothetical protein DRN68_04365 [Nitrososphaerota archaeon]
MVKKIVPYRTKLDAFSQGQHTLFTIHYELNPFDVRANIRKTVETAIKAWCKEKGLSLIKEGFPFAGEGKVMGYFKGYGGKSKAKEVEKELRRVIQRVIRILGYTPKARR